MVRSGITEAVAGAPVTRLRLVQPPGPSQRGERPAWFEPYADAARWRREMWGAIVGLHARYPRFLEAMKDGWWTDEAHTEVLCALAVWRAQIDEGGESPREELAFHRELSIYAEALREQGGGVRERWVPGAPPTEWLTGT
jgi:hypothetical protein